MAHRLFLFGAGLSANPRRVQALLLVIVLLLALATYGTAVAGGGSGPSHCGGGC